jgi:YidC/Oxa1 family membrane protein insertase
VPFFMVVYRLFLSGTVGGSPNGLLQQRLLGASLGSHWLTGPGPWSGQGLVFAALFGFIALAAWLSARAARRWAAPAPAQQAGKARATGGAGAIRTRGASGAAGPAGATGVTGLLLRALPFATVVIAALVPLAAGLYLATTTAWAVAERAVFNRLSPPPVAPAVSKSPRSPERASGAPGPGV